MMTVAASPPMFSVVTPSWNQGAFIERCIRSVLDQNYPRFEHIVADNCSADGTLDILRRYPHVRWISEPDGGQSDAVNKAIARASGDIIAWINADDFHEPGAFAAVAEAFAAAGPDCPAVAGAVAKIDASGPAAPGRLACGPGNSDGVKNRPGAAGLHNTHRARFNGFDSMLSFWDGGYGLCQPGVFFRRGAFERAGPLRTDLHYAMDYDLWLRLARLGPICTIDRTLAAYVVHPQSKSGRARFGEGFNEELEAVSRQYWGPRRSRRHRRLRRGCNRFIAEQHMNALVFAHKYEGRFDGIAFNSMLRRRPAQLLHRHVLAVAGERLIGAGRWTRTRDTVRRWIGAAQT